MNRLVPRHPLRHLTSLGVMLITLACGGGGSATAPVNNPTTGSSGTTLVLTSMTVSLSSSSITVGGTSTATASGKDQNGNSIATGTVTWSSGTTTVATVNSSTGVVTAVAAGTSVITASAGGKTATATITVTASTGGGGSGLTFKMYSSNSATGPWSSQTVTVTGSDALGLVDPSPLKLSDGTILLYYLMSYVTSGDPAASQPGNLWKIGVASSSDNGVTFTHQGVAYTFTQSTTDPFPMVLPNGTIRLLASQGTNVVSVTATDNTGLHFSTTQDAGSRVSNGGVPGALLVGTKNYIYGCGAGILWSQSTDGLAFTLGGTAIAGGSGIVCDPSPIDNGGGSYLMAFKRRPTGASGPNADTTYMASSNDGQSWTQIGTVGVGSVPGLVKDKNGVYRIYVVGF